MAEVEQITGTRDITYNLMSVLYHTLQGAEIITRYIEDAERSGDQELVQFFREIQEQDRERADRAKLLLRDRLLASKGGIGGQRDDLVDEQSQESFPASDSPARY